MRRATRKSSVSFNEAMHLINTAAFSGLFDTSGQQPYALHYYAATVVTRSPLNPQSG
jgi:hypothetical protein